MIKLFAIKSRLVQRLVSAAVIAGMMPGGFAWGGLQPPLSRITVPVPRSNAELLQPQFSGANGLASFVKDVPAAIALGKALFWDMQAGSDGATACASCHYGAGADPISSFRVIRTKNQLHPGPDTAFGNNSTVINTFVTNPLTGVVTVKPNFRATGYSQFAPNYALLPGDFPLFRVFPVEARLVVDPITGLTGDQVDFLSDSNDVIGSQGIRLADFQAVNNTPIDGGSPQPDPIFHTGATPDPAANLRQVTGRNTPSVINAVFNFTNFWDGRANNIFNGVNPLGPLDRNAGIWVENGGVLVKQPIAIPNSSLASQAVGPPLSEVEMSFRGRTFPELGRKLLALRPLGQQLVHQDDSVLGGLSRALSGNPGLATDYATMIRNAFQDNLWNSNATVSLPTVAVPGGEPFSQMEANFSLYWGLAIQLYEATLVSDRSPFDRFQAGNQNALSATAQRGLTTFDGKCAICHSGSEFTTAAVGSPLAACTPPDCNPPVFTSTTDHSLIKQEVNLNTFPVAFRVLDAGFFNLGVRPTAEDLARGAGETAFPFPLSFTRLARLAPAPPFATPAMPPLVAATTPDIVDGSFKTPGLRNVELTPPYFHNGASLTLDQVVEFYTRGGNFPGNPQLAAAMQPIGNLRNKPAGRFELVEFLKSLTDERVKNEWAPFDHPELIIPHGVDALGQETLLNLTATGGGPAVAAPAVLTLNPIVSPTILATQVIGGTVDNSATVTVSLNGGAPLTATVTCPIDPLTLECAPVAGPTAAWRVTLTGMPIGINTVTATATSTTGGSTSTTGTFELLPAATISGAPLGGKTNQNSASLIIGGASVTDYQFSLDGGPFSAATSKAIPINLTNLADGTHTVAVTGIDAVGNQQPQNLATTTTWVVKAALPVLTLDQITTPTANTSLTISGTSDLGLVPEVKIAPPATAGAVSTVSANGVTAWSCVISGLAAGDNGITVVARDFIPNTKTVTGTVTRLLRDGNFKGTGNTDISDALTALRCAVGLKVPTPADMIHGDLAPLDNGLPTQNNTIDIADALLILRKAVGLVTF